MIISIQTGGNGQFDSAIDPDQEYIYFTWKRIRIHDTYLFFNEFSKPFCSTSNRYNYNLLI